MDSHKPKRTDQDFNIAFNGMLQTARMMGVDIHDENVRRFIEHAAECRAEDHAQLRHLYGVTANAFANVLPSDWP